MRPRIGIRVWLPLAFALVAAVTALVVERGVSSGSEAALRDRAQELAAGNAFESALEIRATVVDLPLRAEGLAAPIRR